MQSSRIKIQKDRERNEKNQKENLVHRLSEGHLAGKVKQERQVLQNHLLLLHEQAQLPLHLQLQNKQHQIQSKISEKHPQRVERP